VGVAVRVAAVDGVDGIVNQLGVVEVKVLEGGGVGREKVELMLRVGEGKVAKGEGLEVWEMDSREVQARTKAKGPVLV